MTKYRHLCMYYEYNYNHKEYKALHSMLLAPTVVALHLLRFHQSR